MTVEVLAAVLAILENLAKFGNTPAGQALLISLATKTGPTPEELHAAIAALPRPTPPDEKIGGTE